MLAAILFALGGLGLAAFGGSLVYGGVQQHRFNETVRSVEERSVVDLALEDEGTFAYVAGSVEAAERTVAAPFTGTPCVAYEASVQHYTGKGRGDADADEWEDYHTETDHCRFLVEDGSGAAGVDPEAADVQVREDHAHFVPPEETPDGQYARHLDEHDVFTFDDQGVVEVHETRFVERRLEPGDDVYVSGVVGPNPAWTADARQSFRGDGGDVTAPFVVADHAIDTGEWTADVAVPTVFALVFLGGGLGVVWLGLSSIV